MSDQQFDLDAAYGVDDQMQQEIDKLKADPWELLPNKGGFKPKSLHPDAVEGTPEYDEGHRQRWIQDEVVKVLEAGFEPLSEKGNADKIVGQILSIDYECTRGPNQGKRIAQTWWLRQGDARAVREMNRDLQEIFNRLKLKPKLVKGKDGREVSSYTATLPQLKGKTVKIGLQQKWGLPHEQDAQGNWKPKEGEPMKFKKRILNVKSV